MAKITQEMKEVAKKTPMWAVATASKDGIPNVAPIFCGRILSENEIVLADNFMNKTKANLKVNPQVAVSIWYMDVTRGEAKGYQFKGEARFESSGKVFDETAQMVKSAMPINTKSAVVVKVKSIYSCTPGPDAGKEIS